MPWGREQLKTAANTGASVYNTLQEFAAEWMIAVNNTMEYKGYIGSVEFSEEDGLFYGKVTGIVVI